MAPPGSRSVRPELRQAQRDRKEPQMAARYESLRVPLVRRWPNPRVVAGLAAAIMAGVLAATLMPRHTPVQAPAKTATVPATVSVPATHGTTTSLRPFSDAGFSAGQTSLRPFDDAGYSVGTSQI